MWLSLGVVSYCTKYTDSLGVAYIVAVMSACDQTKAIFVAQHNESPKIIHHSSFFCDTNAINYRSKGGDDAV
jgi:hypothetical protein